MQLKHTLGIFLLVACVLMAGRFFVQTRAVPKTEPDLSALTLSLERSGQDLLQAPVIGASSVDLDVAATELPAELDRCRELFEKFGASPMLIDLKGDEKKLVADVPDEYVDRLLTAVKDHLREDSPKLADSRTKRTVAITLHVKR